VAQVQQIEAAIGDYEFLARLTHPLAPIGESAPGKDFLAKIHYVIVGKGISTWQRHSWFSRFFTRYLTSERYSHMLQAP
jgi:hypothetical protein